MYEENEAVTSQLIDSYAWDTIVDWMEKDVPTIGYNSIGYGNYLFGRLNVINALYAVHEVKQTWITPQIYKKGDVTTSSYIELATGATIADGSTVKNIVKNIYDMAGNMWEWTTEVGNHGSVQSLIDIGQISNASYAVLRGGGFCINDCPLSHRSGTNSAFDFYDFDVSFRVVFYIK